MTKDHKQNDAADFKIAYDGTWYHDGARIERAALAKLFSDRALKVDEDGCYWLQTPFEKYPVDVEDVPYVIVDYHQGKSSLDFVTNMGEHIEVGPDHPVELRTCKKSGNLLPYVIVRDGLYARIGRSVYYNLVEALGASFESRGITHVLGEMD